jgi:hypothetical protein
MADVSESGARVDWGAALAGVVLSTAVGLILLTFTAALGLSVTSPYEGEGLAPVLYAIGAGLWFLCVQLFSFSLGGYAAARLRMRRADETEHETDVRDGMHGLLAWGGGVLMAALIAFLGLSGAAVGAARAEAEGGVVARVTETVGADIAAEVQQGAAEEAVENEQAAGETAAEREAEVVRKLAILAAFVTAASLLAGAAAAFFSAGYGGKHRDQNTRLAFFTFRR